MSNNCTNLICQTRHVREYDVIFLEYIDVNSQENYKENPLKIFPNEDFQFLLDTLKRFLEYISTHFRLTYKIWTAPSISSQHFPTLILIHNGFLLTSLTYTLISLAHSPAARIEWNFLMDVTDRYREHRHNSRNVTFN